MISRFAISAFVKGLWALTFFCMAKTLVEEPRVQSVSPVSTGGAPPQLQFRPSNAAAGYSVQNRKNPGVLLVRFSIDKLNDLSGSYGFQSGKLIGRAVPAALLEGMTISDGDSAATIAGQEYVCVVSIASDDISILTQKIEPLLQASQEIRESGASPITQIVSSTREPLVPDGVVRNGRVEGAGGWCAEGLMSAWKEAAEAGSASQAMGGNTMNNTGNEERVTVMANSAYQPRPKASYGSDVLAMLFSLLLILGGSSGRFVLRGTNSSTALVIAGFAFLAWDIFSAFRKKSGLQKAEEEYDARRSRMREEEKIIASDKQVLPEHVNVRIACDKHLAALTLGPRLNGSAMAWDAKTSEYTGSSSSVRNIVNFNDLDLTAVFEIAPYSGATVMELFRGKNGIGLSLPGNVTLLPRRGESNGKKFLDSSENQ